MSVEPPIHLSPPDLRGGEAEALLDALGSGWVAPVGPQLDAFETELAAATGTCGGSIMVEGDDERVHRQRRGAGRRRVRTMPLKVAHLTTTDISLELLLGAQFDAVVDAGGEAIGISAPGPFVELLERRGARHVALPSSTRGWNPGADVRAAVELWRILRRERPTILHTHNPKPGLYGRVVGRLARVPIVVNTVHGLYATEDDPWLRRAVVYALEGLASRCSHGELVQNAEDVRTIRRFHLAARRKVCHSATAST